MRAYRQKMALRAQSAVSRAPGPQSGSNVWVPFGPAPLASDATGDGGQNYNWVSGRATSVVIDPSDGSGNTVLLGGAYGGLWRSTNAGSLSPDPSPGASGVVWQPLIDDQPTLAVGAIALQPGNSNTIVVGTGETNNSSDSYYGLGILLSTNGGSSWSQITGIGQPPNVDQSFLGVGFSKIAFSTSNPSLVVAATAGDNGMCVGLEQAAGTGNGACLGPEEDGSSTVRGLYYSTNAGASWSRAIMTDGSVPASATSVIYNPSQGTSGTFYAFIRRHGLYSSSDGQHFAPVTTLPIAGLTAANCPTRSNATSCTIYRGEFAVVSGRSEMYVWIVDVQPDEYGNPQPFDEGIWQSFNGGSGNGGSSWTQIPDNGITNCGDDAFGPGNSGCGVEQGWYNLELAAVPDPPPPNSTGTDIYAGGVNLYKCTLAPAASTTCTQGDWINLTHVYGCDPLAAPAHVHPNQHGMAFVNASGLTPGYFAHDGGISRTLDGYSGLDSGSCSGTNQFDSLSQPASAGNTQTLGSMTEFVSVALHPTDANILLGGAQGNGSPATSAAGSSSTWQNALGGDGGFTAINPNNPTEWFAANPYVNIMKCELGTACNDSGFSQIVSSASLDGDQGAFDTPYILDPQNSSQMLVGTCRVWWINTSGTSPIKLSNDFDTFGTGVCTGEEINLVNALAAGGPPDGSGNSEVVYAVTNGFGPLSESPGGEVWVTTNAGVNLMANVTQNPTQNVNPEGYAISSVAMDSSDPTGNTAYVGIMGFSTPGNATSHVWQTTNAGASWNDWTGTGSAELPDDPVNALLVDSSVTPSQIYVGTDVGVFVSSTASPKWQEVGAAPGAGISGYLPNAPVTGLQLFNPNAGSKALVASTYGRGIWSYALVTSPSFTNVISNTPQTVFPTQTATFNGTLTSEDGYNSPVNLSCTGAVPPICTMQPTKVKFSGNPLTATYTMTAGGTPSGTVGNYIFNALAVGTDQHAITVDATVTLQVVDFNLTAPAPNSLTVAQGETSGPSTFEVTAAGSFAGTVTLSCPSGLPSGTTCVFSPSSSVNPTSSTPVTVTLTVTAATGSPAGGPVTVILAATAAGAPAPKTQTFNLTVTAPTADFAIAVTATPATTVVGQNVTWSGTLTSINGYNKSVSLSCTAGAPATCSFSPAKVTPTAKGAAFTATLGSGAAAAFNFTIQGTDGTLTHATTTETLTVGTDVTWTDTGGDTSTVLAGETATYTFSAVPLGGATFNTGVTFGCANLPSLTNCGFNPPVIAAGSQATTVTVTISTTGPNLGEGSVRRRTGALEGQTRTRRGLTSQPLALLMFAWVALAVVVSLTRTGRAKLRLGSRLCVGITAICLALGLLAELSCGGVGGGGGVQTPVTVTVNPPAGTVLYADETGNSWPPGVTQQQFTATVNNSSDQTVTWAVLGGNTDGTIDGSGMYSAPAGVPSPSGVTVTATSAQASTAGSAFLNIAAPTPLGTSQITVTATAAGGAPHSDAVTLTVQ